MPLIKEICIRLYGNQLTNKNNCISAVTDESFSDDKF